MQQIPNLITSLNLMAGCIAITALFTGQSQWIISLMCFALITDFLDGATARLLNAQSDLGKQLDSMADLISFGLLPSVMVYQMLLDKTANENFQLVPISSFLITLFTALRLARFNLDKNQAQEFLGLPSPANAILILGLWMIYTSHSIPVYFLYLFIPISCFLLIAPIKMMSLKFKNLSWPDNQWRFIFLGISLVFFGILGLFAPLFIILLYVLLSILNSWLSQK